MIPRALQEREVGHDGLTELHVVAPMHERKALMAALADGFVVLPGGIGTLEEFFEVWTWAVVCEPSPSRPRRDSLAAAEQPMAHVAFTPNVPDNPSQ